MIHRITVTNEVYETLIILSRLLNNNDDKKNRKIYKKIGISYTEFYPLEIKFKYEYDRGYDENMIFDLIVQICKKNNIKPFSKSIS